ncbi:MAG: mevalonate kinase [Proteobacteria bacterium]|nr:mevalonate kinase [Pseudomonadota bacterium]
MTTIRDIGWGKIILLGEHSVVYGYPALAAALDRGVMMSAVPTPAGGPLRIDIPSWEMRVAAPGVFDEPGQVRHHNTITETDHPAARGLAAIADALGAGRPSVSLVGDAQIPPGAGLGSSAALAVAVARALARYLRLVADNATIGAAANASEEIFHGTPSGIDVALAIAGGAGVFRKSTGLRPVPGNALRVLVGPSGQPRSTAEMVARVAAETGGKPDDPRLRELAALTDAGTTALVGRDLAGLGAAMDRAHAVLRELGVSTPVLDDLVTTAHAHGAVGAKLTGAGGGGSVIAIAPREREAAILAAWRAHDVIGFVTTIGGHQ